MTRKISPPAMSGDRTTVAIGVTPNILISRIQKEEWPNINKHKNTAATDLLVSAAGDYCSTCVG